MGILDHIFKDLFYTNTGRIYYTSGGWVKHPSQKLLDKTYAINPNLRNNTYQYSYDADGKEMVLVIQRSVHCPNPEIGQDKHPRIATKAKPDLKRYSVPSFICKKCQFHKKSDHRGKYRFPRCTFASSQNPAKEAFNGTVKLLDTAITEAKKIMGNP
jgi:hypothetical protein